MTSVLVSVYNAEGTLQRCLDSLLAQTLGEVQIICIDDASTDSSPKILQQYASQHPNIDIVLLKENHGQGYARNQGIPLIRGEYTAFLDSDDYMAHDALENVEHVFAQNPETDCVLLNVQYEYPDGHRHGYRSDTEVPQKSVEVMKGYDAFKASLTWEVHGWYVARTELYRNHPFDDSCHSYSDDNTTMEHYLNSREVRWCTDARYFFVQSPDSCTRGISMRRFDWIRANEILHRKLIAWRMPQDIISLYEEQRYYVLLSCHRLFLQHRASFTKKQQNEIIALLHYAWKNIDTSNLPFSVKFKPFYMPLHPFWWLFNLQQKVYILTMHP